MDVFQIRDILDTFRVVVDNREQITPRAKHRLKALGVPIEHGTLNYGDYAANADMPDGPLLDTSVTMKPGCVIERKMSLDELAACLGRDRARFVRELERAKAAGAKMYLLVEDATWEKIINHSRDYRKGRLQTEHRHRILRQTVCGLCVRGCRHE